MFDTFRRFPAPSASKGETVLLFCGAAGSSEALSRIRPKQSRREVVCRVPASLACFHGGMFATTPMRSKFAFSVGLQTDVRQIFLNLLLVTIQISFYYII